jgi:hypothetical protein
MRIYQEVVGPLVVRNQTLAAVSDALYAAPAVHSAGTFARRRNKSTHFYHFAHATRNGLYPQVARVNNVTIHHHVCDRMLG